MWHYFRYFKNTNYIAKTAMITALLVVIGVTTVFLKFDESSFQLADGFYFALVCLIPGPMMLVAGIIYPVVFDLLGGGFVFIPISIIIHVLVFTIIKLLKKILTSYGAMAVGGLSIFLYVLYVYLVFLSDGKQVSSSLAVKELIVDSVQYSISLTIGISLYFTFTSPGIKKIFLAQCFEEPRKNKKINKV